MTCLSQCKRKLPPTNARLLDFVLREQFGYFARYLLVRFAGKMLRRRDDPTAFMPLSKLVRSASSDHTRTAGGPVEAGEACGAVGGGTAFCVLLFLFFECLNSVPHHVFGEPVFTQIRGDLCHLIPPHRSRPYPNDHHLNLKILE
eukprot:GHVT01023819.1.p1 GENE.GHVT01023819.1~~GHVT01023819.1.p1  ORF type:complete len:145 (+),score=9.24 GHVT01023819.1:75-509(+)